MRVHLGTDHAAFEQKNAIAAALTQRGYEVVDHGATSYDAEDDYPTYIIPAAEATVAEPDSLGVVLGGSGNGEALAANKVRGARAAVVYSLETATLARQHNNANICSMGGRMQPIELLIECVVAFLETPFSNEARHVRRLQEVADYEATR